MLIDGLNLVEGSSNTNIVITNVTTAQLSSITNIDIGEFIYVTDGATPGLHVYNGTAWVLPGTRDASDLSAGTLSASRLPAFTGDATSTSGTSALTLANSGVAASTYKSVTVDAKGRVTAGTNPTTLAGYGITDAVNTSALGANSGVATLDSSGKLTTSQVPAALVGAVQYQGTWNASTNSPALVSSTGTKGQYYKVSTTGTTAIDGLSQWNAGDIIIFNGTTWDKIDGVSSEVLSVAGRTGAVTLTSADVGLSNLTNTQQLAYTQALAITGDATASSTALNTGTIALTLASTGVTAGNYGTATSVPAITIDSKGRISAASSTAISLAASAIASGTIATARLGTGTADATTYLRGDNTWATVTSGSTDASTLTSGTLPIGRLGTSGTPSSTTYLRGDNTWATVTSGSTDASTLTSGTLAAARLPAFTGDATTTAGSSVLTLATVATAGTYKSVTVDVKGRVTAGTNPTTLAGYGITDSQALNANLTSVAALSNASTGLVKLTNGVASLDSTAYLTALPTLSGDVTNSGNTITVTKIGGITVTGTPTAGQAIVATSGTAASWSTVSGGGSGDTAATPSTLAMRDSAGALYATSFYSTSSKLLKENVIVLDDAIDVSGSLAKLEPVSFNFIADETKHTHYGLIAESVEEVLPALVSEMDNGYKTVNYVEIIALLIAEVNSLSSRLAALESK